MNQFHNFLLCWYSLAYTLGMVSVVVLSIVEVMLLVVLLYVFLLFRWRQGRFVKILWMLCFVNISFFKTLIATFIYKNVKKVD